MSDSAFSQALRDAVRASKHSTDSLATAIGLGDTGGAWIRAVIAGRSTKVTYETCRAMERELGVGPEHLWKLLLLDDRKVDPDVRAYYERQIDQLQSPLTPVELRVLAEVHRLEARLPDAERTELLPALAAVLERCEGEATIPTDPFHEEHTEALLEQLTTVTMLLEAKGFKSSVRLLEAPPPPRSLASVLLRLLRRLAAQPRDTFAATLVDLVRATAIASGERPQLVREVRGPEGVIASSVTELPLRPKP